MILHRGKRLGIIEIGSYSVRRMIARFEADGTFRADRGEAREYTHDIDLDSVEEYKVAALWANVQDFYNSLIESKLVPGEIWVYGTELCRRLSKGSRRLPEYVIILTAELEAIMSWATGFVRVKNQIDGWFYTIFDQGGGSAELVSGTWNAQSGGIDRLNHETFDLGHKRLAKLYSPSSPHSYVEHVSGFLEKHTKQIGLQENRGRMNSLILLGGPATKLAFNIEHKKDDNHDYSARDANVTEITRDQILSYYNRISKIYKIDPERARREVDRRMVDTDEYERVMSGALLFVLLSNRLGYPKLTVSAASTRYGFGFLVARGLIENRSGCSS
ncbi:exopolyphosphatase/pppGpp-phosphohydrolase [Bradyrhizobium sp. LM2.7]